MTTDPSAPTLQGLIDSAELAKRLGVSKATIRSWRSRKASWLPEPVGRLEGFVWREEDLVGIEELIPSGPGRPARSDLVFEPPSQTESSIVSGLLLSERRARGAYYTPQDAAHFIASWTLRGDHETLLEPSFGDGSFIKAIRDVAAVRGRKGTQWIAAELDESTAREAIRAELINESELRIGDFMSLKPTPVDAVIANPPYIRLRHIPEAMRRTALAQVQTHLGHPMNPSGSLWMPFVVHLMSFLKPGGRAAVVLPLDFTYVAYARPLWNHLARHFSSLRVLRTRERIFPDINQDVLLLLADGYGGSTDVVDYEAYETHEQMVQGVEAIGGPIRISDLNDGDRAFQRAILPDGLAELLAESDPVHTHAASDSMTFRIGYIAGDKKYFHPSAEVIAKYKIPDSSLYPAVINSRRLKGHGLRTSEMVAEARGALWVPDDDLAPGEERYVKLGVKTGVSAGYKAMRRSPWYRVPGVLAPDIILSVFSERPLLLINDEKWLASNSLLGGYLKRGTPDQFAASWYTPLTLLSIGLQVHSLGGGVIVMVPNEASKVRVLRTEHSNLVDSDSISKALQTGDIKAAYAAGDAAVHKLLGASGLSLVYEGIERLSYWRTR